MKTLAALLYLVWCHEAVAQTPPEAAFEQNLGATLPLNATFADEAGKPVRLGQFFGGRPVVLVFAYFRCPNLCSVVLNSTLESLRNLTGTAGREFEVVVISIDPQDAPAAAAAKKQTYVMRYGRPGSRAGWHFLTGSEAAIHAVTSAAGFRYTYDPQTKQFAHASGLLVATPDGKISRHFLGIEYPPREMQAALKQAAAREVGSVTERLLLLCFHYDPHSGRYGGVITRTMQFAGVGSVVALGAYLVHLSRRKEEHG